MRLTEPDTPIDLPIPDTGLRVTSTYTTSNGTPVIQKRNIDLLGRLLAVKALRAEIGAINRKSLS